MDERTVETRVVSGPEDVIRFYDEYSSDWDDRFGDLPSVDHFHDVRLATLLKYGEFKPDHRAIEIGAGTGPYAGEVAKRVAHLTCVDGSAGMLKVLAEKFRHLDNLDTEVIDLSKPISLDIQPADVVYGIAFLEHVQIPDVLLENCRKLVKDGGRLIFLSANGLSPWYRGVRGLWRAASHCSSDHFWRADALAAAAERAGFRQRSIDYWGYVPPGINTPVYWLLRVVGAVIDATPLRRYAGGFTIVFEKESLDSGGDGQRT